jgi:signal transduction histidine kinase
VDEFRLETINSAAAGIAHDINNQLMLIVNHLSRANVAGVQAAVDRCSALTATLMSYSRGEVLDLVATDPESFLHTFAAQLNVPDTIEFLLNVPANLPSFMANPLALTRVLTNLVSNARAAMDDRGTIRITATPGAIEVSDSGPGIPDDLRLKIFEPFFTTKGSAGTGLGLAIVRELMRQQGGSVTVLSEPGQGAHFALRFRKLQGVTGLKASPRRIAPAA